MDNQTLNFDSYEAKTGVNTIQPKNWKVFDFFSPWGALG